MTANVAPILLGGIGLAVLLIASLRYHLVARRVVSNARQPRPLTLFLAAAWLVGLSLAIHFSPPEFLTHVAIIGIAGGAIFLLFYHARGSTLGLLPPSRPLAIGYIPAQVRYWVCRVDMPAVMRLNTTYILSLRLYSHRIDIRPSADYADPSTPEGQAKLTAVISDPIILKLSKYAEEAMVESGLLLHNVNVKVIVNGPGFSFDTKQFDANIEDLEHTPLRIACLPNRVGRHHIAFDFLDCEGHRCGGIAVPADIREREPFISDRALRTIQIIGAISAFVAALLIIVEKVKALLH